MFSSTALSSFPLVLLLFFVWMIILLVLKRLGAGEVGCARKPPMYPSLESIQVANHSIKPSPLDSVIHSEEEDPANGAKHRDEGIVEEHKEVEDIELWLFEVKVIARGIRRVRIIFLLCGFSIILGSVVPITAGFRVLDGALQTMMQNIQDTNDMIFDNLERINDLILTGQQAALVRSQATEELASWCPKAAENAWTLSSGNFPQILVSQEGEDKFSSLSLKNETNDLLKALEDLEDFLIPGSLRVEDSLVRARNYGIKIYETFDDTADWWFHFVVVFTIIFDALAIINQQESVQYSDYNINLNYDSTVYNYPNNNTAQSSSQDVFNVSRNYTISKGDIVKRGGLNATLVLMPSMRFNQSYSQAFQISISGVINVNKDMGCSK